MAVSNGLTRTEELIVQRALTLTDWFTFTDLYAVASHSTISVVLNRLVRSGDLETRTSRYRAKQFRWVNS